MDSAEFPGIKRAGDHPQRGFAPKGLLEQQLIARVRTATLASATLNQTEWAIVSAHQTGVSIRKIASVKSNPPTAANAPEARRSLIAAIKRMFGEKKKVEGFEPEIQTRSETGKARREKKCV